MSLWAPPTRCSGAGGSVSPSRRSGTALEPEVGVPRRRTIVADHAAYDEETNDIEDVALLTPDAIEQRYASYERGRADLSKRSSLIVCLPARTRCGACGPPVYGTIVIRS
jgi:hypothetical protein